MRRKIADVIEDIILQQLAMGGAILISRNQLAQKLACAPSQISYVLQSRFNQERGFICQSRRGSGGFIRICRFEEEDNNAELYLEQEQIKSLLAGIIMSSEGLNECKMNILAALKQLLEEEVCNRMQLNWIKGALIHIVR